jgi:hypothetical protein
MLAVLNWAVWEDERTYILLVEGVGRHDVGVSALELLTAELSALFLKGEII